MNNRMLSIVIPVFGKWNFTASCLKDLSYLDSKSHEIIVVDNASTDETQSGMNDIQKKFSNISYIRMEENTGFSFACNRGYAKAQSSLVMFLNNDIRVSSHLPSWTDTYIEELTSEPNQILSPTGGYIEPKREFQFMYETDGGKAFNYLSGWMLVSSKRTFDRLIEEGNEGPFRADKYFAYYEDGHLSFRATELKIPLKIVANNSVVHFGHITSKSLNLSKMYNESRKKFLEFWKNAAPISKIKNSY